MADRVEERDLVCRGAPVSAIPPSQLKGIQAVDAQEKDQCDSGFSEGDFPKSESFKSEDEAICSLQESTKNITIEDPNERLEERQPISSQKQDGACTEAKPQIGGHLLDFARCSDVRYLLAPHREFLFVGDEDGDTTLHLAIIHMQQQIAEAIISLAPSKPFLDIFNYLRQTPLHLANITRQPRIVQSLMAAGASADIQDRNGKTALHLACERGNLDCVRELTRPLVDASFNEETRERVYHMLNARDFEGFTALHMAVCANFAPVVSLLVELGADVNVQDSKSGRTALHHAVERGNLEMTGCLIFQCRADVNAMNFDGCTPLHTAAGRGMESMVALLLAGGADPRVANTEGETPLDHSSPEVHKMLVGPCGLSFP